MAKYYDLGPDDVLLTVLTDSMELYGSRLDEMRTVMGDYTEINAAYYSNNKVVLGLNGEKGWLVASERFAHFPGWEAAINNDEAEMFKADNIITAVYLDGQNGELVFEYKPRPYRIGKIISLISALILVIYFGHMIYSRKSNSGDKNQI